MKRMIKNNLVLIVVLGLSLAVTIGLLVWTTMEYIQMSQYIAHTEQLRSNIANLNQKTPAPVKGNEPLIEADTAFYSQKGEELRIRFGHPLQPALERFVSVLRSKDGKEIPLKQFKEDFTAMWNQDESLIQKNINYMNFKKNFRNWKDAMDAFRALAKNRTAEEITDNNIDDIFWSSLGVMRRLKDDDSGELQRFMLRNRQHLLDMAKDKILFETPEAENFSFGSIGESGTGSQDAFQKSDYPMIAQHWEILGDFVKRALGSGIRSFLSFRRRAIQPEKSGSFDVFHYSIEVTGTMESLRKLVSILNQAYEENRVYVVRSIFLYDPSSRDSRQRDEAGLLMDEARGIIHEPSETAQQEAESFLPQQGRRRREAPRVYQDSSASDESAAREEALRRKREQEEEEKEYPYNLRSGYGETLIGSSDVCRAIIDVEYVMESGNGI